MDNYYLNSDEQIQDAEGFINFDLPTSFQREKFCRDLMLLKDGQDIEIPRYEFKIEGGSDNISIKSSEVIIVEGLFIYHYDDVIDNLDYKVMVQLPMPIAYERRLKRDITERDYTEEVTRYRYMNHVEPAYQKFIDPHMPKMDLIVDNTESLTEGEEVLKDIIKGRINS